MILRKQPQVHNISHSVFISLHFFMTSFTLDNPDAQTLELLRMVRYLPFPNLDSFTDLILHSVHGPKIMKLCMDG